MDVKTTLNIDDALLRDAKAFAARNGTTLTGVIERALRDLLRARATDSVESPYRLNWPVRRSTKLPDIDIADRDAMFDRFDGRA